MFKFFDQDKPGPGVPKDEPQKPWYKRFFIVYFRKFWNIISLNLLYFLFCIPIFVLLFYALQFCLQIPMSYLLSGANEAGAESFNVVKLLLMVSFGLTAIIGAGPITCGMSYILRNYAREEHAWVWSDFREQAKKNFGQALAVYLINLVFFILAINAVIFYLIQPQSLWIIVSSSVVIVAMLLFAMMQPYVYVLMVTFKMNIGQIYKNAFLLTMIRFPQNILNFIAGFAVILGILLLFDIQLLFILLVPLLMFTTPAFVFIFNANSVVKKYMIAPFETEKKE